MIPKPYYDDGNGRVIYHGDCLDVMASFEPNRFIRIITDPPYGLSFMGKQWDHGIPGVPFWEAALRVAKPGAFLLAFGGTRTFHRLTTAIEDAGWEIRDCMMWLYGSGFPKSLDISKALDKSAGADRPVIGSKGLNKFNTTRADKNHGKYGADHRTFEQANTLTGPATDAAHEWSGWGTALKPAWEPIIVAMKPLDGTFAENALQHGVAGLNIDGGRIGSGDGGTREGEASAELRYAESGKGFCLTPGPRGGDARGRWPANVVLDEFAAGMLDEQSGELRSNSGTPFRSAKVGQNTYGTYQPHEYDGFYGDTGGASRFFYTAKANQSERGSTNNHPTVKPLSLMKYLLTLTASPTGGEVLDPFAGSGTTIVAAQQLGQCAVGIDIEKSHCDIQVERLRQGGLFGSTVKL